MRDLVIALIVFGAIPITFLKPHIGLLVWSWLGYMNPHRLSYGFAYDFPFVLAISFITLLSVFIVKEKKTFPINGITLVWLLFIVWMVISTFLSFYPEEAMEELIRTIKIQAMVMVTILLFSHKDRIIQLVWVIVFSLGYYGVKGGFFTAITGGSYTVWGPPDSFVEGNNELALALVVILPLMFFLFQQSKNKYLKYFLIICLISTIISILGSYSRGAFLALSTITVILWLKSNKKIAVAAPIILIVISAWAFLPDKWFDRMNTVETYEEDASAMGRINAWYFAFYLAVDHPMFGGGYGAFSKELFHEYAPVPEDHHDAHSIYFEVLAEQGFVGLILFLVLGLLIWRHCSGIVKATKDLKELLWAKQLALMCQVSLIGYATGGTFLGLAYYDLPYHVMAIVIVLGNVVKKEKELLDKDKNEEAPKKYSA